ncbi:MAG: DUF3791 domain-containing protein [Bacteroidaceae bacterium]|nr:DUF3791 domain-containing protein [Bacteroidaceae bacterium]
MRNSDIRYASVTNYPSTSTLRFRNPFNNKNMKDYQLYRKITRIIMQLSEELHISSKQAMLIFYNSTVGQQLHDPKYGYQLMSDTYIVNDIKAEFANL